MDRYPECHVAGGMTAYNWEADPKRLAFQSARYKFVAKMLAGKKRVLEVGCSDGQGARIVRQHVGSLVGIDVDGHAIDRALKLRSPRWPVEFHVADILRDTWIKFDAVYCLDLFEHIIEEDHLLDRLRSCAPVCLIGTPSRESQQYASEISKREHVNCKSGEELRKSMLRYWNHVFMFGMNDEVVHTGDLRMAHYLFALAVS